MSLKSLLYVVVVVVHFVRLRLTHFGSLFRNKFVSCCASNYFVIVSFSFQNFCEWWPRHFCDCWPKIQHFLSVEQLTVFPIILQVKTLLEQNYFVRVPSKLPKIQLFCESHVHVAQIFKLFCKQKWFSNN